jgi:hypothetical protein
MLRDSIVGCQVNEKPPSGSGRGTVIGKAWCVKLLVAERISLHLYIQSYKLEARGSCIGGDAGADAEDENSSRHQRPTSIVQRLRPLRLRPSSSFVSYSESHCPKADFYWTRGSKFEHSSSDNPICGLLLLIKEVYTRYTYGRHAQLSNPWGVGTADFMPFGEGRNPMRTKRDSGLHHAVQSGLA